MTNIQKSVFVASLAVTIGAVGFVPIGFAQQSDTGASGMQSPSGGQPIGRND
jgi:hypothetical protein